MSRWRTLLILGRVSNLPTVWSNCLAGWWLGGGATVGKLPFVLAGATCLYLGGTFLNDAFDTDFDRQHRRERPIPSRSISVETVRRWGLAWLALGTLSLFHLGMEAGVLGLVLLLCILLYSAIHKLITFSPVLMGICRLLVYIVAASAGTDGVTGRAVWCGFALAAYVQGLSFIARRENARGPLSYWPLALLGVPIFLACIMDAGVYREAGLALSAILALWSARSLHPVLGSAGAPIGRAVSGLLAGIVFVDLLAVADAPHPLCAVFLALFGLAVVAQRFVPAT